MKILIRNLARSVSQKELEELFKPFGAIDSCTVVLDKETGKSKGFAFVEMPDPRQAIKAVKGLNTLRVHGYGIKVKVAEDTVKPSTK